MWKVIAFIAVLCAITYATPPVHHRPLEFNSLDVEVVDFEKGLEVVEKSFYEGMHKRKSNVHVDIFNSIFVSL